MRGLFCLLCLAAHNLHFRKKLKWWILSSYRHIIQIVHLPAKIVMSFMNNDKERAKPTFCARPRESSNRHCLLNYIAVPILYMLNNWFFLFVLIYKKNISFTSWNYTNKNYYNDWGSFFDVEKQPPSCRIIGLWTKWSFLCTLEIGKMTPLNELDLLFFNIRIISS